MDRAVLDAERDLNAQLEEWLRAVIDGLDLTPERFAELYELEFYPLEFPAALGETTFFARQIVRIVPKVTE